MPKNNSLSVSIGVFAYNEERNINKTLDSLLKQKTNEVTIKEIIVVSSGSNDRTNQIVRKYVKKHKNIFLIDQLYREGKSSAINEFIRKAKADILIAISGDLRIRSNAIEEITLPFHNSEVGMVGSRPIPSNIANNPVGQQIRLLWHLHHLVSLQTPKCGEMVAFRKVFRSIPKESAVDEASIEVIMNLIGYHTAYAPRAIVYNKGPESVTDLIKQRRRVYAGHLWVSSQYHYQVSTLNSASTKDVVIKHLQKHPEDTWDMTKLIGIEALSRLFGWVDFYLLNRNPYVWDMVKR